MKKTVPKTQQSKPIKEQTKSVDNEIKNETLDLTKWTAFFVAVLGAIFLGIGVMYRIAYWQDTGIDPSMLPFSTVELASLGYLTGVVPLLFVLGVLLALALFIYALNSIKYGWLKHKHFVEKLGNVELSIKFILIAIVTLLYTIISSYMVKNMGNRAMQETICHVGKMSAFPSTFFLENGKSITGKTLARSDKLTVLVNHEGFHVITVGEKPRLLDTTRLPTTTCN